MKKKFKILLLNTEYLTGLTGRKIHYIIKGHRYFYTKESIKKEITDKLKKVIYQEDPDLICLIEIGKIIHSMNLNQNMEKRAF